MSTVVTAQPRLQDSPEKQNEDANTNMIDQEEKEARKKENQDIELEEACCCVLESTEDIWCICHCIAWCFRSLGHCTDECCEGCAQCISDCCESSGTGDTGVDAADGGFCCDCDCSD